MKRSYSPDEFIIRPYRSGDFEEITHLWELTGMRNTQRGDNETIIEESINMGGSFLIMEEKSTLRFAVPRG